MIHNLEPKVFGNFDKYFIAHSENMVQVFDLHVLKNCVLYIRRETFPFRNIDIYTKMIDYLNGLWPAIHVM